MKKFLMFIPIFLAFGIFNITFADIPIKATPFYESYKDIDMVNKARELRSIDEEIAIYIYSQETPIDIKAAVINALGWRWDEEHAEKYSQIIYNKPVNKLNIDALTAEELFSIGYLKSMHGGIPKEAIVFLEKANEKMKDSFTVAIITALSNAQLTHTFDLPTKWNHVWEPLDEVLQNKNLNMDLRVEAREAIFDGTNIYRPKPIKNPYSIKVSPESMIIKKNETLEATINGTAPYFIEYSNNIEAISSDNKLIIKGILEGQGKVKIRDNNHNIIMVPIRVMEEDTADGEHRFQHIETTELELAIGDPYMKASVKHYRLDPFERIEYYSIKDYPYEIDSGKGTAPFIYSSRTMVPIRKIIEKFQGTVEWFDKEERVKITLGENTVELWIDSTKAIVNGIEKELDVASMIRNERTFLPLRFISENLGCEVEWNDSSRRIKVTAEKKIPPIPIRSNPEAKPIVNQVGNSIGNIMNNGLATSQGEWVYYRNSDGKLYKSKILLNV